MVIFVFIRVVPRVFRAALGATSKHSGQCRSGGSYLRALGFGTGRVDIERDAAYAAKMGSRREAAAARRRWRHSVTAANDAANGIRRKNERTGPPMSKKLTVSRKAVTKHKPCLWAAQCLALS